MPGYGPNPPALPEDPNINRIKGQAVLSKNGNIKHPQRGNMSYLDEDGTQHPYPRLSIPVGGTIPAGTADNTIISETVVHPKTHTYPAYTEQVYTYFYKKPKVSETKGKETSSTAPVFKASKPSRAGIKTTVNGSTKPTKGTVPTPPKEIPSQYDLLFNSLNYMSVNEAEVQNLSMDLIFAGDDLLTDFDYRSVDYLPDFDIEMKTKSGYVDAVKLLGQTEDVLEAIEGAKNINDPTPLDGVIDELIKEMKDNLENQSFAKTSKYFGAITSPKGFLTGYSKGQYVDFRYFLADKYKDYDIEIDFNPI